MTLGGVIGIAAIGLFGVALIMFPELRTAIKGAGRLFVRDRLATPEGAESFFTEYIEEVEEKYSQAHDSATLIGGKYKICCDEISSMESQKLKLENEIDRFLANGDEEFAGELNQEWIELVDCLEAKRRDAEEFKQLGSEAVEAMNAIEKQLKDLKKEKVRTINELKTKKQLADAYKSLNGISDTENDRALDHIREKVTELSARASGEVALYNGRTSVKLKKAEDKIKATSGGYIGQVKQRRIGTTNVSQIQIGTSNSSQVQIGTYNTLKSKERIEK